MRFRVNKINAVHVQHAADEVNDKLPHETKQTVLR